MAHLNVLFFAAIFAAAVGCSKNEVSAPKADVPITFEPVAHVLSSKAAIPGEVGTDYSIGDPKQYESFKVWAGYNGTGTPGGTISTLGDINSIYFESKTASKGSNNYWSISDGAYWPKGSGDFNLAFHAFSPADIAETLNHNFQSGFTFGDYTVKSDVTDQLDILYSDYTIANRNMYTNGFDYDDNSGDDDSEYKYKGVNIKFNHALAAVKFKVKTNSDYTQNGTHTFTVKSIQIGYARTTGKFHENRLSTSTTGSDYAEVSDALITTPESGYQETIINKWVKGTGHPYWSVKATELDAPGLDGNGIWNSNTYVGFSGSQNAEYNGGVAKELTGAKTILAMPQKLDHTDTGKKVTIQVAYDYVCKNASGTEIFSLLNQHAEIPLGTETGKDKIEDPSTSRTIDKWLINHKYIYTINFKLDEIIFDPAVTPFVEVSVDAVDVQ